MYDKTAIRELRRVLDCMEAGASLTDGLWQIQSGETTEDLLKDQNILSEAKSTLWKVKEMQAFLQTFAKDLEPAVSKRAKDLLPASYHQGLQDLPDSVLVEILSHIVCDDRVPFLTMSTRRRSLSMVSKRFLLLIESTSSLWSTLSYVYPPPEVQKIIVEALRKSRRAPIFLQVFEASGMRVFSDQLYRCRGFSLNVCDIEKWKAIMDSIRVSSSPDLAGLERLQLSVFQRVNILEQIFTELPLPNLKHLTCRGPQCWPTQASRILAGLTTLRFEVSRWSLGADDTETPMLVFMKALQVAKKLEYLHLSFSNNSFTSQKSNTFDTNSYQEIEVSLPLLTVLYIENTGAEISPFHTIPCISGTMDVPNLHTLTVIYNCDGLLYWTPGTSSLFPTRNQLDRVCLLNLTINEQSERFSREPKTVTDGKERRDMGTRFDRSVCDLLRQIPLLSEFRMNIPFLGRLFHFVELCPNLYSLKYEGKLINDMDAFADFMDRARDWAGPLGHCVVFDTDYEGGFPHKDTVRYKGKIGNVDMLWKDTKLDKTQRPSRRHGRY